MPDRKKPTLAKRASVRSIAKAIALSPATVSLALRGDNSIPPETRQRVLAAAETLNYTYVPRGRKANKTRMRRLAFVVHNYGDHPVTANPFYGYILSGAEEACREQHVGLSFVVVPHDYPPTNELPLVLRHDLDGILLTSPYPPAFIKRICRESACPVVLIDNTFPGSDLDAVMADDFGGAYQAIEYLLESGHRQILMLTGRTGNPDIPPSFQERYRGYCAAYAAAGLRALPPAIVPAQVAQAIVPQGDIQGFQLWLQNLLGRSPHITAFFGASDHFALPILRALHHLGHHVPQEFSVVGFDDSMLAQVAIPPLTTIHSYKEMLARVAVERLLARIDGDETPAQNITLATKLIVRSSSAAPHQPKD